MWDSEDLRGPTERLADEGTWRFAATATIAAGFLLRVLLIAATGGGSDLHNYTYFSRIALNGGDPFHPPPHGAFAPIFANSPPLEFLVFAGFLGLHNSPVTLRMLFAISDLLVLTLLARHAAWSRARRLAVMAFYAVNPFVLIAWTANAEDKTLLFLGIVGLIFTIERGDWVGGWATTTALCAFKFFGSFLAPLLCVGQWRATSRGARRPVLRSGGGAIIGVLALVIVSALTYLPWAPASLDSFSRRNARLAINPPIHASVTLILSKLGLYAPVEAKLLPAISFLIVLALLLAGRIRLKDAIAWAIAATYMFLPDTDYDRVLLSSLPFLLVISPSPMEWLLIWIASLATAAAAIIAEHPNALASLSEPAHAIFGYNGTVRYALWVNLFFIVVAAVWTRRRCAERALDRSAVASSLNLPHKCTVTAPRATTHKENEEMDWNALGSAETWFVDRDSNPIK